MNPIDNLTEYFTKFPGIGPRQARRFAYFLLAKNPSFLADFQSALGKLREEMAQCVSCYRYFQKNGSGENICSVCSNTGRDKTSLLIVEKDVDFENIHKTGTWNGLYFILGGSVPILEKEPSKKIRAKELFTIVQNRAKESELREVVLAMSANPEGENTAQYLLRILDPLAIKYSIAITELGRGLSSGTELEYSDSDTLKNAIQNRK